MHARTPRPRGRLQRFLASAATAALVTALGLFAGLPPAVAGGPADPSVTEIATLGSGHSLGVAVSPVAITPAGASTSGYYAYSVDQSTHQVTVYNTANNSSVGSAITVGTSPSDITFTPDGAYVIVGDATADTATIITTASGATHVVTLTHGSGWVTGGATIGVTPVAITPHLGSTSGFYFYVPETTTSGQNYIAVVDPATHTAVDDFSAGSSCASGTEPAGLAVSSSGADVFSCWTTGGDENVSEFATATAAAVNSTITVTSDLGPGGIAVHGSYLWIGAAYSFVGAQGAASIIDTSTDTLVGSPIVLNTDSATGFAFAPDGLAFVLSGGDQRIVVLSSALAESASTQNSAKLTTMELVDQQSAGHSPSAIAVTPNVYVPTGSPDPANNYLYVADTSTHDAYVYEAPNTTGLVNDTPGGATVGVSYSVYSFTGNGAPAPDISLASGSIPAGLTLSGGVLFGTPTTAGTSTFTLSAVNATGQATSSPISIVTAPGSQAITFTGPGTGVVGSPATLSATSPTDPANGGAGTAVTFTVDSGSGSGVCSVSGTTLTYTGPGTCLVDAHEPANSNYNAATQVQQSVTVAVAPTSFSAAAPPAATTGTAYTYSFIANGTPAPTYTVGSGALPTGLTLSSSGVLSGTPTVAGTTTFTITATNGGGSHTSSTITLVTSSPVAPPAPPTAPVFTAALPPAVAGSGTAYSYTFAATGTPAPTYSVGTGSLPPGLTLSAAGLLSGTPTTTGIFTFTVLAANTAGQVSSAALTITTQSGSSVAPVFTAAAPPAATIGQPYSYGFAASGTPAPTFAVSSGTLPAGLQLDATTGVLSGTPTGSGTFAVTATNTAGQATAGPFTVTAQPAPPPPPGPVPPAPVPAHVTTGDGTATVTLSSATTSATARFQVSVDGGLWRTARVTHRDPVTILVTGLTDGRTSTVRVRAGDAAGWSAPCTVTVRPRTWVTDPVPPRARHAEVAVPADPTSYRGPLVYTTALDRSHNGTVAVPLGIIRGRPLHAGQAAVLSADGLFAFNSAELTSAGVQQVRHLVRSIRGDRAVTCEGYSDYGGLVSHEKQLAAARAEAVCHALKADGARVQARAVDYGPSRPVVLGGQPPQRSANRRVDIFVNR